MTRIEKLRGATEESVARDLAKIYIEGMLMGMALAKCKEGDKLEGVSPEDVNDIYNEFGGEDLKQRLIDLLNEEAE
jgi:hypothetical protein